MKREFSTWLCAMAVFLTGASASELDSRVKHISATDGLASNNVHCIAKDHNGYIWVGTDNGLCRFDGYHFRHYRPVTKDGHTPADKRIGELRVLPDGEQLEAITSTRDTAIYNLTTYEQEGFRPYIPQKGDEKQKRIYSVRGYEFRSDAEGCLTIRPPRGKERVFRLIEHPMKNRDNHFNISVNRSGTFYIAAYGGGLYSYNPYTGEIKHYSAKDRTPLIGNDFLTCILTDNQNNLWIGCEDIGLFCIRHHSGIGSRYVYPLPDGETENGNNVRTLSHIGGNRFFVSTRSGKNFIYDLNTDRFTPEKELGGSIYCHLTDRQGNHWAGMQSDGLYLNGQQYSLKSEDHPLPHDRVFDLVQDDCNRVWIATFGGGLLCTTYTPGEPLRFDRFLQDDRNASQVRDLETDSDGTLWIATNAGLFSLDTKAERIDPTAIRHEVKGKEVQYVHASPTGELWLGVQGEGLVKMCRDAGNLYQMDCLNHERGLHIHTVRAITSAEGGVWASMEEGVCYVSEDAEVIAPNSYTRQMESNAFNEHAVASAPDGTILFGSRNGILILKGKVEEKQRERVTDVRITDLAVNGISIWKNQTHVKLPHGQNNLRLHWSDFDYARTSPRLYQYYLEEVDSRWHTPTNNRSAEYDDLPPGNYLFHIRLATNSTHSTPVTTLAVTIRPPWYNTPWAWAAYLLTASVILWLVFRNRRERFRLHRQMEMDRQLSELRINFFTHIAHEFRTPLAIIQNAAKKLKKGSGTVPSQQTISQIARGTGRLSKLIDQLMEFRKLNTGNTRLAVSEGDIIGFIRYIFNDFLPLAQSKGLHFAFLPFDRNFNMLFDRKAVEIMIYNLVSNAVKYTPEGGNVTMKARVQNDRLTIELADSGQGVSPEQLDHLFKPFMHGHASQGGMGIGLYMAHSMAAVHHGSLTYRRTPEGETVFTLTLPIDTASYAQDERATVQAVNHTEEEEHTTLPSGEVLPKALNHHRVAIVEDDPDIMAQLRSEVGQFFHVDCYSSGERAVESITEAAPSLVLCDVMLPGMDGYEVVRRLKLDNRTTSVPVIMLTVLNDETHQIKAYEAGADDYMTKPCNFNVLMVRIVQLIKWAENHAMPTEKKEAEKTEITPLPLTPSSTPQEESNREETEKKDGEGHIFVSRADKIFIDTVNRVLAENLSNPNFSIDELAEQTNVGRTTLFGRMKKLTGMPPNKYINKLRMEQACKLMTETNLNISEVGFKVGIQDPAYFYRLFKSFYGMSPTQFKQQDSRRP